MFRTLSIILLSYFLLKYLGRILAPILLRRFARKMQERFQQQFNNQQKNWEDSRKKEGILKRTHRVTKNPFSQC